MIKPLAFIPAAPTKDSTKLYEYDHRSDKEKERHKIKRTHYRLLSNYSLQGLHIIATCPSINFRSEPNVPKAGLAPSQPSVRLLMPFHIIPFLLIVVPIAEISAFVVIGGKIGLLPTLALIVLTAIVGSVLLRWQGLSTLSKINAEVEAGGVPGRELAHGAMILVAGILLLVPGFVTDTLGILLFIPPIRDMAWRFLRSRVSVVASSGPFRRGGPGGPFRRPNDGPNGRPDGRTGRGPVVDLDEEEFSRSDREPGSRSSPWSDEGKTLSGTGKPGGKEQDGL